MLPLHGQLYPSSTICVIDAVANDIYECSEQQIVNYYKFMCTRNKGTTLVQYVQVLCMNITKIIQ